MRLLLIDDHALFRHGLKFLLTDLDAAITALLTAAGAGTDAEAS